MLRAIQLCLTLGLSLATLAVLQTSRLKELTNPQNLSDAQVVNLTQDEEIDLQLMKNLPTLGFRNLMANYAFLQFLQYFGDSDVRSRTSYSLSPDYFEIILDRDPFYIEFYQYFFPSVSFYAGQPEQTVTLAEEALAQMSAEFPPRGYLIWRNKAIDEMLLLNQPQKAIESMEIAATWAEQSDHPESEQIAAMSRQTAAFLQTNPDSRIARALAWSSVLNRAIDERSRELAMQKIQEFGGEVTITPGGAVQVFLPKQD